MPPQVICFSLPASALFAYGDYMDCKTSIQLNSPLLTGVLSLRISGEFNMRSGFNQLVRIFPLQFILRNEEVTFGISEGAPFPIQIDLIGPEAFFVNQGRILGNIITEIKVFNPACESIFYLFQYAEGSQAHFFVRNLIKGINSGKGPGSFVTQRHPNELSIKIVFELNSKRRVYIKGQPEILFIFHIVLKRKKPLLMLKVKLKLFLGILGHADFNFNTLAGDQGSFLVPSQFKLLGPHPNRDALVAVLTPGPEKIIAKMAHAMGQQVFKLYLRDILKQIFLEQGFPVFKVPALK